MLLFLLLCCFACDDEQKPKSEITVLQNSVNIKNISGTYDFGFMVVDSSTPEIEFNIQNVGDADLLLDARYMITVTGTDSTNFIVDDSMTFPTILPEASTFFTVKFAPNSIGKKTAIISIANNDSIKINQAPNI